MFSVSSCLQRICICVSHRKRERKSRKIMEWPPDFFTKKKYFRLQWTSISESAQLTNPNLSSSSVFLLSLLFRMECLCAHTQTWNFAFRGSFRGWGQLSATVLGGHHWTIWDNHGFHIFSENSIIILFLFICVCGFQIWPLILKQP